MATRAEIQTLIDTDLASASDITATEHRNVLANDADSILNNIYMTPVNDTHSSSTITTSNANFNYDVEITKIGRQVHIVGTVSANASLAAGATMFAISDAEYQTTYQAYGKVIGAGTTGGLQISSNNLNLLQSIFELEVIFIDIVYEVTN